MPALLPCCVICGRLLNSPLNYKYILIYQGNTYIWLCILLTFRRAWSLGVLCWRIPLNSIKECHMAVMMGRGGWSINDAMMGGGPS
jgi:hypothetical protein